MAARMLAPAGRASRGAPLSVSARLTGCVVWGAATCQPVNVRNSAASHSAPRTRDRSIIRTSPKGDVSTIVPPRVPMGPLRRVRHITSSWADGGVEKLSGQEKYRIRQGDYRVLYSIDDTAETVTLVKWGHSDRAPRRFPWSRAARH